jgi:hypothetical protein
MKRNNLASEYTEPLAYHHVNISNKWH